MQSTAVEKAVLDGSLLGTLQKIVGECISDIYMLSLPILHSYEELHEGVVFRLG